MRSNLQTTWEGMNRSVISLLVPFAAPSISSIAARPRVTRLICTLCRITIVPLSMTSFYITLSESSARRCDYGRSPPVEAAREAGKKTCESARVGEGQRQFSLYRALHFRDLAGCRL